MYPVGRAICLKDDILTSVAVDKQKILLSADVGHFSLVRAMHLADLITLMNGRSTQADLNSTPSAAAATCGLQNFANEHPGFCGVMSIFSSLKYCLGDADKFDNVWVALTFLPFGMFFDLFDGKVARWRKKSSLMGQELDSLADLVSLYHIAACLTCAIQRQSLLTEANAVVDLLWCRPRHGRIHHWLPIDG